MLEMMSRAKSITFRQTLVLMVLVLFTVYVCVLPDFPFRTKNGKFVSLSACPIIVSNKVGAYLTDVEEKRGAYNLTDVEQKRGGDNYSGKVEFWCESYNCRNIGLVDRIKGALFAFLISKATNKDFRLNIGLSCPGAFEQAFSPATVDWRFPRHVLRNNTRKYDDTWQHIIIAYKMKGKYFKPRILKENVLNLSGAVERRNVRVSGNSVFLPELVQNPRYGRVLRQVLGLGAAVSPLSYQQVAERALPLLLQPSTLVRDFMSSQLSIRGSLQQTDQRTTDPSTGGLLCAHYRQKERRSSHHWRCDEVCRNRTMNELASMGRRFTSPSYLIVSDSDGIAQQFQVVCPECQLITSPGLIGHTAFGGNCNVDVKATWELAMLTYCDVLFLSHGSFYAKMAHFMRRNSSQHVCFNNRDGNGPPCIKDAAFLAGVEVHV